LPVLSVFASDVLLDEIIRRGFFSAFTGALWLLFAIAILRLFKVKNPAVKHVFYALALLKGFVALVREQPLFTQSRGAISVFLQFPNPGAILQDLPEVGTRFFRGSSSIAFGPGVVVLASTVIFLLWRFLAFMRFQRLIQAAPEIDRRDNTVFFAILDRVVEKARVVYPKVISINSNNAPFTVGLKRPVIAFSPALINQLGEEEVAAVLAHEVAHIARRDYLYHWPIVAMRDVLFFSPLTYIIYRRLSFERERACDDFSAKLCNPLMLAKSLVRVAEINEAGPAVGLVRAFAPQSFLSRTGESYFSLRVMKLIDSKPSAPLARQGRALFLLGAGIFVYVEIHVAAFINGSRIIFS